MNDPDDEELHGITREQFINYMKGSTSAIQQLKNLDRDNKYLNGNNPEELATEKGKHYIHVVTARALYTGKIKIQPKETIAQLEERMILGNAALSNKPEDKTIRMESMKHVLQNNTGEALAKNAKDGKFETLMSQAETTVRNNMAKGKGGAQGNQMGDGPKGPHMG